MYTLKRHNVLYWSKEYYHDTRLARKKWEYSNATGHYPLRDEVMFIDRDLYGCARRAKEAIPIRLYPDNFNGIVVLRFYQCGCPRANDIILTRCDCRPLRGQSLRWATRIEILQSTTVQEGIEMYQLSPNSWLLIPTFNQSTQSPVEDQQYSGRHVAIHYPFVTQLRDKRSIQLSLRNQSATRFTTFF